MVASASWAAVKYCDCHDEKDAVVGGGVEVVPEVVTETVFE
jgi:hypothetical protein